MGLMEFVFEMARIVLVPIVLFVISALLVYDFEERGGLWKKYWIVIILVIWAVIGALVILGNKLLYYIISGVAG